MNYRQAFEVLGLNPGATGEDIDDAWKRLSRKSHPDVSGDDGSEQTAINQARDIAFAHSKSLIVREEISRELSGLLATINTTKEKQADYDREFQRSKRSLIDPIKLLRQKMLVATLLAGILSILSFEKISPIVDAIPNPYPPPLIGPSLSQALIEFRRNSGIDRSSYPDDEIIESGLLIDRSDAKVMEQIEKYLKTGDAYRAFESGKKQVAKVAAATLLLLTLCVGMTSLFLTYRLSRKTLDVDAIDEFVSARSNLSLLYRSIFTDEVPASGWTYQELVAAVVRWIGRRGGEDAIYIIDQKTLDRVVATSIGAPRFAGLVLRKSEALELVEVTSEVRAGIPLDIYRFKL